MKHRHKYTPKKTEKPPDFTELEKLIEKQNKNIHSFSFILRVVFIILFLLFGITITLCY